VNAIIPASLIDVGLLLYQFAQSTNSARSSILLIVVAKNDNNLKRVSRFQLVKMRSNKKTTLHELR